MQPSFEGDRKKIEASNKKDIDVNEGGFRGVIKGVDILQSQTGMSFVCEVGFEEMPALAQEQARSFLVSRLHSFEQDVWSQKSVDVEILVDLTPRRLFVGMEGLPAGGREPQTLVRRGPRVGAPDKAIEGFLKAQGFTSVAQCEREVKDGVEYYIATVHESGVSLEALLKEWVPRFLGEIPFRKVMRWPQSEGISWPRPIRYIACSLGGSPLDIVFAGARSRRVIDGHRSISPHTLSLPSTSSSYIKALENAHVLVSMQERAARILDQATHIAQDKELVLEEDVRCVEENAALVEWPVVGVGRIDETFMQLPREILRLTLRVHQKYFTLRAPNSSQSSSEHLLAPYFLFVSDGGDLETGTFSQGVALGHEQVVTARLLDAMFVWGRDKNTPPHERAKKLKDVMLFGESLTIGSYIEGLKMMCHNLANHQVFRELEGFNSQDLQRVIANAKLDLTTETVGEFPELQGIVGSYLAAVFGEKEAVVDAVRDQYKPKGPSDSLARHGLGKIFALVDKMSTILHFFSLGQKPTGSGDPYALRRLALGVLRILIDLRLDFSLQDFYRAWCVGFCKEEDAALFKDFQDFIFERMRFLIKDAREVPPSFLEAVWYTPHAKGRCWISLKGAMEIVALQQNDPDIFDGLLQLAKRIRNILKTIHEPTKNDFALHKNFEASENLSHETWPNLANDKLLAVRAPHPFSCPPATSLEMYLKEELSPFVEALALFFEETFINDPNPYKRSHYLKALKTLDELLNFFVDFSRVT